MTDTARTLEAILALLADNSSEAISAQDVRDLAQSIATPVTGGGFDRPFDFATQYLEVYAGASPPEGMVADVYAFDDLQGGQVADIATPGYYIPAFTQRGSQEIFIPDGWLVEGTYDSDFYAATFPASTVLLLPAGLYAWDARIANPAGDVLATWCAWDVADYTPAPYENAYPVLYGPTGPGVGVNTSSSGYLVLPEPMHCYVFFKVPDLAPGTKAGTVYVHLVRIA